MATNLNIQQTYLPDAFGINDSGEQAGSFGSGFAATSTAGIVYGVGKVVTLPTLGGLESDAMAVNNSGEVVGDSQAPDGSIHAVLWKNGILTDLSEGWFFSSADAVNNGGDIAGTSSALTGSFQAELWVGGGKALSLGDLGGGSSNAYGLNSSDQVVGKSSTQHSASHAFLWQKGVMADLGTLGGPTSEAVSINDSGAAVGEATTGQDVDHAVLWQAGHIRDLGTLGGATSSAAGIDSAGQVVGVSTLQSGSSHAFVWENGVMIDLNTLLAPGSGWVLEYATAISTGGQVCGFGTYNGGYADFVLTLPSSGITQSVQAALQSNQAGNLGSSVYIGDTSQNISKNIDSLQSLSAAGTVKAIGFSDASEPVVNITYSQLTADSAAIKLFSGAYDLVVSGVTASQAVSVASAASVGSVEVSDSSANVSANLGNLQPLAQSGKLAGISLSDAGIPSLSITASELGNDAAAIKAISGNFTLSVTAPTAGGTVAGASNALGNTMSFAGSSSQFTVTPSGDGVHFTVSGGGVSDTLSDFQALQFSDTTLIVTRAPGAAAVPTSGNIAELYGAVFGRLPDVPGLTYYENSLASNPGLSLTTFAQQFLASPEYQNNSAHVYAQNSSGDTQFITDLYSNLLRRTPASGDAAWYEANVIAPITKGLTSGTNAYTAALNLAHAYVVTDFSQSAEFLNDVQVTSQKPASAQHWLVLI